MFARLIAPSLLAADFSRLGEEVRRAEASGADWLHLDVMDGNFVPNISFGPAMVRSIRPLTALPFDVQLMVKYPGAYMATFADAGANRITVHLESEEEEVELRRLLHAIRKCGCKAGLAVNPDTSLTDAEPFFTDIDLLLIMTVHPGFGGQSFMPAAVEKIEAAYVRREARGLSFHIEVDGGINSQTAASCLQAGADVLVAGTSLFGATDMKSEIEHLRALPGRESPRRTAPTTHD